MLLSVNFISGANWDNVKNKQDVAFDGTQVKGNKLLEMYSPIEIVNTFGLGETLFEGYLTQHDDVCLINCKSTMKINLHKKGVLIDDITFRVLQKDGSFVEEEITNYQIRYSSDGEWKSYNLGKEIKAGIYVIELYAKKQPYQTIDWVIKTNGKWLEEWALWGEGDGLISYYKLDETSGTVIDSHGSSNGVNYGATPSVAGKINTAYNFSGEDDYINCSDNSNLRPANVSVSAWIYSPIDLTSDFAVSMPYDDEAVWDEPYVSYSIGIRDTKKIFGILNVDGVYTEIVDTSDAVADTWYHVVLTYNGTTATLYKNASSIGTPAESSGVITYGGTPSLSIGTRSVHMFGEYWKGRVDEIGIWNRSLNSTEVTELYNSGEGLPYEGEDFSVELNQPENDSTQTENVFFNVTLTPPDVNITNSTLKIWNSTDSLIYENTQTYTLQNTTMNENWTILEGNFSNQNYLWNVEGCYENQTTGVYINCTYADYNYSFTWVPFSINTENHTSPVIETSYQTFTLNISTAENYSIQNGRLVYNGTIHDYADKTDLGSGDYFLTKSIYIPSGVTGFSSENRSFYWNLTIVNEETGGSTNSVSSSYNQTVNELLFGLCGGVCDVPILNFTLYDEETGVEIDGAINNVTFQATFNLGGTYTQLLKNYSINNLSVNTNEFDFCTSEEDNIIYCDMDLFYSAEEYADKDYFLNNATLTNNTNEIALYLLNETNALEFFISVKRNLIPLPYVSVNVEKYFIGEGVYKTVEIDETGVDGDFTSYLDLDKKYKFKIYEDDLLISSQIKKAICESAPCRITLTVTEEEEDLMAGYYSAYADNVLYNLSYNGGTKMVIFDFIDTTGTANYFRLKIFEGFANQSDTLIYDKILYTSSGQITYNMSNYTSGGFTAKTYIARSPDEFIGFLNFNIEALAGALGIFGLFISLILILVIIFGFSVKPVTLIMGVPLALTLCKLMGIVSLSSTAIISIYILGGVAVVSLSR